MAYSAAIVLNSGESFTATGLSVVEGKIVMTGASAFDTRTNRGGLNYSSATAGTIPIDSVVSIAVT